MKQTSKHFAKQLFKVFWSYEDSGGIDHGVLDIWAASHKDAEDVFKKNNQLLIKKSKGKLKYNSDGGFVIEGCLTLQEWQHEGCPDKI